MKINAYKNILIYLKSCVTLTREDFFVPFKKQLITVDKNRTSFIKQMSNRQKITS